jgi:glyoxylase-like metal-dependent hydrolase (beta-lactamase superfamily II)
MVLARASAARLFERAGMTLFERGWLSSNNVLFVAGTDTVLVDTGYSSHAAQTVALVRNALRDAPLRRVVNTHLHSDHCGGNHALQAAFGCSIDVPVGEAAKVDAWDEARLTYRDTGQSCERFVRHGLVAPGDQVRLGRLNWRALAAPGHDPESLVFFQPELKVLLSADALWENGFGVVFPEIEGERAFQQVADTLSLIEGLGAEMVVPGHGAPFVDVGAAVARARSRLDAFVRSPERHARHAAKVLVKFHLLEHQSRPWRDLRQWLANTHYLLLLHARYFASTPLQEWSQGLIDELCGAGALRREGSTILNA